jgi:2-polyprenyl-3-methyl-5-hydroxy-6-metoxy-1,4-benzoquinol methylase
MFWRIIPKDKNWKFSFAIVKHPDNVFKKSMGSGRDVIALFDSDKESHYGYVDNNPVDFLRTMRKLNSSNYVHTQLSGVCPFNLEGFQETYRSCIRGVCPKNFDETEFKKEQIFEVIFGPFPVEFNFVEKYFVMSGFKVENINNDENVPVIKLTNLIPISITETLQKIYIISYFLTTKFSLSKITPEKIEKFISLSSSWLNSNPIRNFIVKKLCKNNKNNIEFFEKTMIVKEVDLSDDAISERMNKLNHFISRESLHDKRHNLIVDYVNNSGADDVIELGSGSGQLIKKLQSECDLKSITGIEKESKFLDRFNSRNTVYIIHGNILYPRIKESRLKPDFLVCTEVIEHMNLSDRIKLVGMIKSLYVPKEFIITVPNIEYNVFYEKLNESGELRHPDHKIEYTREDLYREIIIPLESSYDIDILSLDIDDKDINPTGIQPSWIIYGRNKNPEKRMINRKLFDITLSYFDSVYLPISDYDIRKNEISDGVCNNAFIDNVDSIVNIMPTMAPVDYDINNPEYLEHPMAAFKYYKDRGKTILYAEEKYMGSQACITIFKNIEVAHIFNSDEVVMVSSRNGYKFFNSNHEEFTNQIYKQGKSFLEVTKNDFVSFNCEILPWSFKSGKLISNDFKIPGLCTYYSRKFAGYKSHTSALQYLNVLKQYSENEEVTIKIFDLNFLGSVKNNRIHAYTMGYHATRSYFYEMMNFLNPGIMSVCNHYLVDLHDNNSQQLIVDKWESYCDFGGEGFVIKPMTPYTIMNNGYLLQPSLKVRGKDYLRLIYGIDYLERECFDILTKRSIKNKRIMAIQELELSNSIMKTYLNRNVNMKNKLVAAFIGMDSCNYSNIDATL